jgi:hypothetical protein
MTNKDTSSCTPNPEGKLSGLVDNPGCLRKCTDQYTSSASSPEEYPYQKTMLSDHCKNYCENNWNCVYNQSTNGSKENLIQFCQSPKAIKKNATKWRINPTYKPICSCFYPINYYKDLENELEKNLKLGTTHRNIGNPTCWLPDCFRRQYFTGKLFTTDNKDSNKSYSDSGIYPTSIQPPSCNIKQFQQCVTESDVEFINSQGDVTIDQSTKCLNSLRDDSGDIDDTTDDDSLYDTIGIIIVSVVLGIPLLYFIIIGIISLLKKK